jgi:hypothetical protein
MVHCRVISPYLSLSHPTEGDDMGISSRNWNVLRGYTRRRRDSRRVGIGTTSADQTDDAITIYDKVESCAREHMVYHM